MVFLEKEKHLRKICLERNQVMGDFPGGPVVKMLHSQCRGPGFDP